MDEEVINLIGKTLKDNVAGNNPNLTSRKVRHIILHNPLRRYFIEMVKAPLLKAIISLAEKYPEPTKESTDRVIAHTLLDCFDEFHKHNLTREDLFHAIGKVVIDEVEHDSVYCDLFQIFLEHIIEAILDGKWKPRELNKPADRYWGEEKPYGGEHTIIYKLTKHREEVNDILNK